MSINIKHINNYTYLRINEKNEDGKRFDRYIRTDDVHYISFIYKGDATDLTNNLKDKSINLILTDPPYGITQNKWDVPPDWKKIAIELGIEVHCINRTDLKEDWQIEEQLIKDNLLRRHLFDYQKVVSGIKLDEIGKIKEKAIERKLSRLKKGDNNPVPPNLEERGTGETGSV